jgi:hypothetical protein
MKNLLAPIILLALLPACASAPVPQSNWKSLEFAAGPQDLDESSWAPLDARVVGALTFSGRKPEWPLGIEFGTQYARAESQDDSVASGADFLEFRVGAAWNWLAYDWLRLCCGAGPRLGLVRVTSPGPFNEVTEQSASLGLYAHAGAFVRVHGCFSIGLDGRWADGGDYDVLGASRDASATELLVALRWDL